MKKKIIVILSSLFAIILIMFLIIVISKNKNSNKDKKTTEHKTTTNIKTTGNKKTTDKQKTTEVVKKCNVSFDCDGSITTTEVIKGEKINEPTAPTKEGYTFDGWYYNDQLWVFIGYVVTDDLVLKAKWTINSYEVSLSKNIEEAGTISGSGTYDYNSSVTITSENAYGYKFIGWYGNEEEISTDSEYKFNMPSKNINYVAKYEIDMLATYNITYNLDGGTNNSENPDYYTYSDDDIILKDPSKTEYRFIGWYTNESFDESAKIEAIPAHSMADITLYAKFEQIRYNIIYELFGKGDNNPNNPTTYAYLDTIYLDAPTAHEGYTFDTWYLNGDVFPYKPEYASPTGYKHMTITGDMKYFAHFLPVDYTITYTDTLDAENTNLTSYNIETNTFTLTNLTKDGYDFLGWTDDIITTPTLTYTIEKGSIGDKTIKANFKPIAYTITYNDKFNQTNPNKTEYTIETETFDITDLDDPTGYVFNGWYDGETKVTKVEKGSMGDIILDASYNKITYFITYTDTLGANNPNLTEYNIETETFTLTNLTKDGYNFLGWTDSTITTPTLTYKITKGSTGDRTIKANFEVINYVITYANALGIYNPNPISYNIETETFTLTNISKNGYNFLGWTDDAITTPTLEYTITKGSTGKKTIYANFDTKTYTITYIDSFNQSNPNRTEYTIETETFSLMNLDNPNGYIFNGWYFGTTKASMINRGSSGDLTFTAVYDLIEFTIDYQNCDGIDDVTFDYESSSITLPTPEVADYKFDGWYLYNTDDLTLTEITNEVISTYYDLILANNTDSEYAKMNIVLYARWLALLTDIEISSQTTSLNRGATFSFGGTVTAHYSDSSTKVVTSDSTFSGYDMSKSGTYTVTVSYTENEITKTKTYSLTVNQAWSTVWSGTKSVSNPNGSSTDVWTNNVSGNHKFRITFSLTTPGSGTSHWEYYKNGSTSSSKPSSPISVDITRGSNSNNIVGVHFEYNIGDYMSPNIISSTLSLRYIGSSNKFNIYATTSGNSDKQYNFTLKVTKIECYY